MADGAGRVVIRAHAADHTALLPGLAPADLRRAESLTGERAAAFLAGRAALLAALEPLAPGARIEAVCAECGLAHGQPRVEGAPGMHLSLAHAAGLAFAIAATRAVGVDAEPLDTDRGQIAGAASLSLGRGDPLTRWTAIEAVLKADGRGLRVDPAEVRIGRRTASLHDVRYRLSSQRLRGCRVTVAIAEREPTTARPPALQPTSGGSRV